MLEFRKCFAGAKKKGVLAKGVSAPSSVTPKKTKNTAAHLQRRDASIFANKPFKNSFFFVPDSFVPGRKVLVSVATNVFLQFAVGVLSVIVFWDELSSDLRMRCLYIRAPAKQTGNEEQRKSRRKNEKLRKPGKCEFKRGNFPVTPTQHFPQKYCRTNGRRTAVQMGGVLLRFPFFKA